MSPTPKNCSSICAHPNDSYWKGYFDGRRAVRLGKLSKLIPDRYLRKCYEPTSCEEYNDGYHLGAANAHKRGETGRYYLPFKRAVVALALLSLVGVSVAATSYRESSVKLPTTNQDSFSSTLSKLWLSLTTHLSSLRNKPSTPPSDSTTIQPTPRQSEPKCSGAEPIYKPGTDHILFVSVSRYSCEHGAPILIDPVYATPHNFTGSVLDGYASPQAYAYPHTIDVLMHANEILRDIDLQVLVKDIYRPERASRAMVAWCNLNGHSNWVGLYVATRSKHNRGRSVDLTFATLEENPREVWMGVHYDGFEEAFKPMPLSSDSSRAYGGRGYSIYDAPPDQLRRLLSEIMARAGLEPYSKEFWHFTDSSMPDTVYDLPFPR